MFQIYFFESIHFQTILYVLYYYYNTLFLRYQFIEDSLIESITFKLKLTIMTTLIIECKNDGHVPVVATYCVVSRVKYTYNQS